MTMILDVVEVAKVCSRFEGSLERWLKMQLQSHTSLALAKEFAEILETFGISKKVQ
jgi:hypothetical protein